MDVSHRESLLAEGKRFRRDWGEPQPVETVTPGHPLYPYVLRAEAAAKAAGKPSAISACPPPPGPPAPAPKPPSKPSGPGPRWSRRQMMSMRIGGV